jgi:hypothetical protein
MNERIQELAEQAWNYVDNQNPYASDEHEMFQEKFAELIVKECVSRILRLGILEDIEIESDMIADAVLEHFGIENSKE